MIIAVDIGNTNIKAGVFEDNELVLNFRFASSGQRQSNEYGNLFSGALNAKGIRPDALEGAIVSSVVPGLTDSVKEALCLSSGARVISVDEQADGLMPTSVSEPEMLGADRVVNAYAASRLYTAPLIVVDFGTAITFDYVNGHGVHVGGAIAPGMRISAEALAKAAARLPRMELECPPVNAVGRNTLDAMRSGFFWGFSGLVEGIVGNMEAEQGPVESVVSTGGDSGLLSGRIKRVTHVDEHLTLKGLNLIYRRAI